MAMAGVIRPLELRPQSHSWTALVIETAGLGHITTLTAKVRAPFDVPPGYRLVIQEFAHGGSPGALPIASAQRAVEGTELLRGLTLRLFRNCSASAGPTRVVAWLEPGAADLEFDGLEATPDDATWFASASAQRNQAQLILTPVTRSAPTRPPPRCATQAA